MYDENETVHCDCVSSAVSESPSSQDDIVELQDEEGNTLIYRIDRYLSYNKNEYVVLVHQATESTVDNDDIYIMKVDIEMEDNEEMEVFSTIEDDALYETLVQIVNTKFGKS